jgi:hypothetical protein
LSNTPYVDICEKWEFFCHVLEGVYTLQAEMKSGGGLGSGIYSQLKSPGEIGETVY